MLSILVDKVANNQNSTSLSFKLRKKRFSTFLDLLRVTPEQTILDVGGESRIWLNTGLEKNVTLLNLTPKKTRDVERGFRCIQGNALDMHMFEDRQFDIVFSNSVIEHVGSFEDQRKFAEEVKRVGKSYWVQTPNKMFPIEPHFLFPYFQFFPEPVQKKIALKWKFSHYKQWKKDAEYILDAVTSIRLISRREILKLFSGASLYKEKVFGFTKSYIAYKSRTTQIHEN